MYIYIYIYIYGATYIYIYVKKASEQGRVHEKCLTSESAGKVSGAGITQRLTRGSREMNGIGNQILMGTIFIGLLRQVALRQKA